MCSWEETKECVLVYFTVQYMASSGTLCYSCVIVRRCDLPATFDQRRVGNEWLLELQCANVKRQSVGWLNEMHLGCLFLAPSIILRLNQ